MLTLVGLGLQLPSQADFDDAPALRATSAVVPGTDIEVQVDDSEWTQTVLLVDDDTLSSVVDPTDPTYPVDGLNKQASYRFYLQGLHNIGFTGIPSVDCPLALTAGAINFWDTTFCAASPSAALLGTADLVIWYTSEDLAPLSSAEIADLSTYLGGGGDLYLESHEYLAGIDSCLGPPPYSSPVPSPGCIPADHATFINTYLGIDGFTRFARSGGNTRPLPYDPVLGDPISDAADPATFTTRRRGAHFEVNVINLSTTTSADGVFTDNDASFGGSLPAGDNFVMTRLNNGTARVVFTPLFMGNQQNNPDPNNFRTIFGRAIRYLSDAPSVTLNNARTGESETIDLSNSGRGVSTGAIATASGTCPCPSGDGTIITEPGDKVVATYTQSSPGVSSLSDTTTIVDAAPLTFTDSGGTAYAAIPTPGSFYVQINDADKNTTAAPESVSVIVSSDSGDSVTVSVAETGGDTNVFRSSAIPTDPDDTSGTNSILGVDDGGSVSASYSFLGGEVTKTFTQSAWQGGTTDTSTNVDTAGFSERDDQTAINSDEKGYFVIDDPANLSTDWIRNNYAPQPNPQISNYRGGVLPERFDSNGAYATAVVQEPASADYYLWYTGENSDSLPRIGLAQSFADSTAPVGREFIKYPSETTYLAVIDPSSAPAGSWWECGAARPTVAINPAIPFGTAGHFIMYFQGTDLGVGPGCGAGGSLTRIGGATSADGLVWSVAADPISEVVPGAPLEPPFNVGGDFNPALIYDPSGFPLLPYKLWFDNATSIFFSESLTGAGSAAAWSAPAVALAPGIATEWDNTTVSAPSVALDSAAGLYVMYYEGGSAGCPDSVPASLFFPSLGRAENLTPSGLFSKPAAPSEQAALCDEPSDGAVTTYENIIYIPPPTFGDWDFAAQDPMLLIDPTDNLDRLWYNSPTEAGRAIGLAWNIAADPAGTLHSNPIDTFSPGFTTVDIGALNLTHLGHVTADLSARTSDALSDLLFDPAPGVAYPAGSPFLVNGALLGDFSNVTSGEQYLQYRVELAQDTNPGVIVESPPPASLVFSDAIEEISLDVHQRENLVQALAVPAEGAVMDALINITDITFTQNPTEQAITYDFSTALDESTKMVVDPNGGEVLPGEQLDYSINVTNSSASALTQVTVSDEVPLGTTYLAGSIFGTGGDDSGEPTLRWTLGTLDPGESEVIGFSVIVNDNIGEGSELLNQAFINSAETGVIPTDNPATTQRRDPTIIPVGARLVLILAGGALLAGLLTYVRERRRGGRAKTCRRSSVIATLIMLLMLFVSTLPIANITQAQSPGNEMYFEVIDGDRNLDPALVDTVVADLAVTPSGDNEPVTLTETDLDTGTFRTSLRAVLDNQAIASNGLIEVRPGDTITLSYEDEFNTSGSPVTLTDSVAAVVDPLYTVSVISRTPRLLTSGGQEAEILASPRDVFGVPASDGTSVSFDSSVGTVDPDKDTTAQGVASTLFSSPTIVNPTTITAGVSQPQGTDSGSLSLTTRTSTTTTTSTNNVPLNEPPDINLPGTANQVNNIPPPNNNVANTTIGNQVSNAPTGIMPREPQGKSWYQQIQQFLAHPVAQTLQRITNRIVAPVLAGVSALNLALATTVTLWYPFLLRIFLEPAQVLFGRRRRPWGVIYHSLSKQPIDLAIVRLRDVNGSVVSTKVTDRFGRYGFLVQPGRYQLSVTKVGFEYPSKLLRGDANDNQYRNLYYGTAFSLDKPTFVNYNIPVDPTGATASVRTVLRRHAKNVTHNLVAYSGLVLGTISLVVARTWLALALLVLHVVVFALFRRLARGRKAPRWGTAYDRSNDEPLAHTVVRIFDGTYNRVLEQQVADRQGRFGFLVGKSSYYLDAIKSGYTFPPASKGKPRDYIGGMIQPKEAQSSVALDLPLDRLPAGQSSAQSPVRPALNPAAPTGPIAPSGPTV
ncbi:MAG: hypothetical protein V1895_03645 [Parcubacteria group bacterium]